MSVADGGDNSLGNLQAICVRCNDSKDLQPTLKGGGQVRLIDHKVSVADGGDNSLGNLQAICVRCNDSKGEHSDLSDGDVSQLLLDI